MRNRYCEAERVPGELHPGPGHLNKCGTGCTRTKWAFTLIEVLVVISVISLLVGILVPVLSTSRSQAKQAVCSSNIRQLLLANTSYANENGGSYIPAATDIFTENKNRWYGKRNNKNSPFDPELGPLTAMLSGGRMKCPQKVNFVKVSPSESDYDQGSGGYGYNMTYLGSRIWEHGYESESCSVTTKHSEVRRPSQTLMFADTAMARNKRHIEYSFAEPRYFVVDGEPLADSGWDPSPSIHFRHRSHANVGWADGHVTEEKMGDYDNTNPDGTKPADMKLGWFEPMDNTRFDLK